MEAEEEHEGQVFTGQLLAFLRGGSRGDVSEATAKTAVTWEMLGKQQPKRRWLGKRLGGNRQNGSDRGKSWKATAKTAVTGETVGKPPPVWRLAGKRLDAHSRS